MTEIVVIAALAANRVIGRGSEIPWHLPADFRRFRQLTWGSPCLMGETTYRSLPDKSRPLRGRENLVLSLNPEVSFPEVEVLRDFHEAISWLKQREVPTVFVMGGATIYRLALPIADRMELTHLHQAFEGDVLFPEYDLGEWDLVSASDAEDRDIKSGTTISFTYSSYRRRTNC